VGGTGIKAALFDADSLLAPEAACPGTVADHVHRAPAVRERLTRPTPPGDDPDAVLAAVVEVIETLRHHAAGTRVTALGVVVPGIIDEPRGLAVAAANVGWSKTPVRDLLAAETGLPVALGHDVRAACLAEWRLGAARGASRVLFVTLGTGIGAGVVSEDRLLVGGGYAGQLGHVVVDPDGAPCGCGQRGCLATVASARAVVRRYTEAVARHGAPAPSADLSARDVAALARGGDPLATSVWCDAVAALASGLVTAVTVYGSELVVLGGGLALAGDQLLVPVREAVIAGLTFLRQPRVVSAAFADGSGVLGAALLARDLMCTADG
ncbi:MAG TPA: ROK family protein, partial [Actinopolymorphaceae bacterium]|nr:ROK family protein [Actinopolymorphaceae bacterium]